MSRIYAGLNTDAVLRYMGCRSREEEEEKTRSKTTGNEDNHHFSSPLGATTRVPTQEQETRGSLAEIGRLETREARQWPGVESPISTNEVF